MRLLELLGLCSVEHSHDWVTVPGNRPATAMVAGLFDAGSTDESEIRPLVGHSIAVYEPDPQLALVWPVPEEHRDDFGRVRGDDLPEWAATDSATWKSATPNWAVVLLAGTPIWQERVWYLDWGSGIGGYVPDFRPVFKEREALSTPELLRWDARSFQVNLAGLLNTFSPTESDWARLDPTRRIVPNPDTTNPIDAQRGWK